MLAAIAGDIIGSPYERRGRQIKTTEFPLFQDYSRFTDDTVLTVAVAHAILTDGDYGSAIRDFAPAYRFDVSCQGSVPESIIAFLESDSRRGRQLTLRQLLWSTSGALAISASTLHLHSKHPIPLVDLPAHSLHFGAYQRVGFEFVVGVHILEHCDHRRVGHGTTEQHVDAFAPAVFPDTTKQEIQASCSLPGLEDPEPPQREEPAARSTDSGRDAWESDDETDGVSIHGDHFDKTWVDDREIAAGEIVHLVLVQRSIAHVFDERRVHEREDGMDELP